MECVANDFWELTPRLRRNGEFEAMLAGMQDWADIQAGMRIV